MIKRMISIFLSVVFVIFCSGCGKGNDDESTLKVDSATTSSEKESKQYSHETESASMLKSGTCGKYGDNIRWEYYSNNLLYIYGKGEMEDFEIYDDDDANPHCNLPWPISIDDTFSVIVEPGVTTIGVGSFHRYYKMKQIMLPRSVTTIGYGAFFNCISLDTIFYSGTEDEWGKIIYNGASSRESGFTNISSANVLYEYYKESSNDIENGTKFELLNHSEDKTIIENSGDIGDENSNVKWEFHESGVLYIYGNGNMKDFKEPRRDSSASDLPPWDKHKGRITAVVIELGVNYIGAYCFYEQPVLEEIKMSDSVTEIGKSSFNNCYMLNSIQFSNTLRVISEYAFGGCESLSEIELPKSLTEINSSAFYFCNSLTSVEIPDKVQSMGHGIFNNCENLKEAVILAKVETIGDFFGCTNLETVVLPDSIKKVSDSGFKECSSLKSINLPDNISSIGNDAFNQCTSLESIKIVGGEKLSIDNFAFSECSSLEKVELICQGNSYIGMGVFDNCSSLASIELPEGLETIYDSFSNCNNLKNVYYHGSKEKWESINFNGGKELQNAAIYYKSHME